MADWQPAIDLEVLRRRAEVMDVIRAFFRERGYLEVETPMISRDVVVDAHLEPFVVPWEPEPGRDGGQRFLQTSPEFAMKRLLAAGATAVWQSCRVARQGELGRWHEPEFTMIEWYRVGDTHVEQMAETEALVGTILHGDGYPPFERLTYDAAFAEHAGREVLGASRGELSELADNKGVHVPEGLESDRDGLLNLLLHQLVEPRLGRERPTFLHDYPASQSALARVRDVEPPVAERFELYAEGIELANGYHELLDPVELERRNDVQNAVRTRDGRRPLPSDSRLLEAMRAGLPPCSGVALGFDRLMAILLGATSLAEVVPFPFERA